MAKDLSKILGSLQTAAVSRCRERLDEAASRARGMVSTGGDDTRRGGVQDRPEYGVTSLLKHRHGL